MTNDLVEKARIFATQAHGAQNQLRKYTGEPYITHPAAVVAILCEAGVNDPATLAAAWMHDVLEDCPVAPCEIGAMFGADIEAMVVALTDSPLSVGNRAKRKTLDNERLSQADARVQSIKVADLIHNTSSIDPDFSKVYLREKATLLPLLTKADPKLLERARSLLVFQ